MEWESLLEARWLQNEMELEEPDHVVVVIRGCTVRSVVKFQSALDPRLVSILQRDAQGS